MTKSDYTLLEREPIALPQVVKDGILLFVSGLTVFNVTTFNVEQQAWILGAAAFVSVLVTLYGRQHAWPDQKIQNEFLSAEDALPQDTEGVHIEEIEGYGEVPVVDGDE